MDDLDAADSRIQDALQAALAAGEFGTPAGMVVGYVAAIAYVDDDGEHCAAMLSTDGMPTHAKLGLIRVAELGIEEDVRAWWWDTDD